MIESGICPECGTPVGSAHNIDPYKHAIHCLHLDAGRAEDMIHTAASQSEERGRRAAVLLAMAG